MRDANLAPNRSGPGVGPSGADRDATVSAIVVTLFLHLLVFWLVPNEVLLPEPAQKPDPEFVEILLEPVQEPALEEQRYIKATSVPEEQIPEDSRNYSDRNQVAAQEEDVPPSREDMPYLEGEMAESNRFEQGNPYENQTPVPPSAGQTGGQGDAVFMEPAPRVDPTTAAPDVLEADVIEEEGLVATERPDEAIELPEEIDNVVSTNPTEEQSELDGQGDSRNRTLQQNADSISPTPRPRMRVTRDRTTGPLKESRYGAIRRGPIAVNSRFSQFGEYWKLVEEMIYFRWINLMVPRKSRPLQGRVELFFYINRKGEIEDLKVVENTSDSLGQSIAVDSVLSVQPFREFTPEMIATAGERIDCQVGFIYY